MSFPLLDQDISNFSLHKVMTMVTVKICVTNLSGGRVQTLQRNFLSLVRFEIAANYAFIFFFNKKWPFCIFRLILILYLHTSSQFIHHCHTTILKDIQITYNSQLWLVIGSVHCGIDFVVS